MVRFVWLGEVVHVTGSEHLPLERLPTAKNMEWKSAVPDTGTNHNEEMPVLHPGCTELQCASICICSDDKVRCAVRLALFIRFYRENLRSAS